MHQQHVTRQTRRRNNSLLEVIQDITLFVGIEVGQGRLGNNLFLESNRRIAAVRQWRDLYNGPLDGITHIATNVVPDHLKPFGAIVTVQDRERKGLLVINQPVTAFRQLHVGGVLLGDVIDLLRERSCPSGLIHRNFIGIRVLGQQGQLPRGQVLLILIRVLVGNDEQWLVVRKRIHILAVVLVTRRNILQPARPLGNGTAIPCSFRANGSEILAQSRNIGFRYRRDRTG